MWDVPQSAVSLRCPRWCAQLIEVSIVSVSKGRLGVAIAYVNVPAANGFRVSMQHIAEAPGPIGGAGREKESEYPGKLSLNLPPADLRLVARTMPWLGRTEYSTHRVYPTYAHRLVINDLPKEYYVEASVFLGEVIAIRIRARPGAGGRSGTIEDRAIEAPCIPNSVDRFRARMLAVGAQRSSGARGLDDKAPDHATHQIPADRGWSCIGTWTHSVIGLSRLRRCRPIR